MNILAQLSGIKKIYENGGNMMQHLAKENDSLNNSSESIMISYDFQAGSYIKYVNENHEYIYNYTNALSKEINKLGVFSSLLEVGVGEATTLSNLVPKIKMSQNIFGFDISWSRLRFARKYAELNKVNAQFFLGDLFNTPLLDNSIDLVYTSHSIEPNGGREKEALLELFRITNKYLILLEPSYEHANDIGKKRMESLGYIKNLFQTAVNLGLNVIEHRLFDFHSNPLNPTQLIIIKKEPLKKSFDIPFACPIMKAPLKIYSDAYFCKDSLLAYPILDGIPLLLPQYAVISTHFMDFQ